MGSRDMMGAPRRVFSQTQQSLVALGLVVSLLALVLILQDEQAAWDRDVDKLFQEPVHTGFTKANVRVAENKPGFPSFWNYAPYGSISVSYDERAILLNGTRSLFLGGSMHPGRATPRTWTAALDEAVKNGLNMVTMYVFWSQHQPFRDSPFDWSLPGSKDACGSKIHAFRASMCGWDLATAIRQAGNRGLFVHARIGPYVDSEFSYGAIPAWVALNRPEMSMRRPNQAWMDAMENFLKETIHYLTRKKLWAYQGGPIILGQVENELGDDWDLSSDNVVSIDTNNGSSRKATMQDYADWSGETAAKYAPNVLWTMCNGLTAKNAINTCNGFGPSSCSQDWLETHGQNGRIQIDQPAMWTENEGGFQVWGESPTKLTYIWGRTARDFTRDGMKWIARGGTHLNYYMFWGSYNRGQIAAGGITNMYANDAILCPSGERRHPKFGHLQMFHQTVIDLAPVLLESPSALLKNETVLILTEDGWQIGKEQRLFVYASPTKGEADHSTLEHIAFVENDSIEQVFVHVDLSPYGYRNISLDGLSSTVFGNGFLLFGSATIDPQLKAFRRMVIESPVELLDWTTYPERIGVDALHLETHKGSAPMELTALMFSSHVQSDYVWYETVINSDHVVVNATISIEAQRASAMSVFVDGEFKGSQSDPDHEEGPMAFNISLHSLSPGNLTVSILYENFGYGNEIGRWGYSTQAKTKGITGSVVITGLCKGKYYCSFDLVDGRQWLSSAGLHGSPEVVYSSDVLRDMKAIAAPVVCTWSRAFFTSPSSQTFGAAKSLFLDITIGRGSIWLNGYDLGRYWNISRGSSDDYSERYYFLPEEILREKEQLNELVLFNSLGGDHRSTKLVLSGLIADNSSSFEDIVDYHSACI